MANFVVISDAYWNDPFWGTQHYIPHCLAREHTVLFVEKATTWISPLKYDVPRSRVFGGAKLKRVTDNLFVYTPRARLPFDRRYRAISRLNQELLAGELNRLFEAMRIAGPHVISFDHKAATLFEKLRTRGKKCYYVVDEVSEFDWPLASKKAVVEDEIETMRAADAVVATSEPLLEKSASLNPNVCLLSHGVDLPSFSASAMPPEALREIRKPIVGFLGKIEAWVDVDLVAAAAGLLPDASFVLIGPIRTSVDALKGRPNVHLPGACERRAVPAHLSAFSCGIIPFRPGKLTQSVNPLKLYEYLAAGLPVVSTPLPAVAPDEELGVCTADTPAEFAAQIERLLASDSPDRREARLRFSENNSWRKRAEELVEFLGVSA